MSKLVDLVYLRNERFSSLMCPTCDKNLQPHYHNGASTPSFYYCQEKSSPYANTPHYKYFNEDGYGYEVFLIWIDSKNGKLYTVKKSIENNICVRIDLTYSVDGKPTTRIYSPEEFEIDPKDLKALEERITKFVEVAQVFG